MKRCLMLFLFMFCLMVHEKAEAQALKITGAISDVASGESLPGVSVTQKGTTKGAISDLKGKFSIEVTDPNAVLVFSFIGYQTTVVHVGGKSVIDVKLIQDTKSLEEVVVVGYGTAKRANLTTAQVSVSAKDMDKTVNTTLEQAIQGRTAGVYITQNSGQPGGGISVNIRGVNSINATNEPLYVIDGVQIAVQQVSGDNQSSSNPLAGLNPNDIADIQVLQGPSATALYGSRATNGVLLISTKRGKAGESKISYNYQYTLQAPPKHLDVMNLRQYAQMTNEFHSILGGTTPDEYLDPSLLGEGTNWQSELFKNAGMYKHQLSLSGGNEKTTYYLTGEYLSQDGVAAGSGFDRYSFRINLDNKPREWMTIGANLSFNQTKEQLTSTQQSLIVSALTLTPGIPVKNIDGTWGGGDKTNSAEQFSPVNPIAIANLVTNDNTRRQFLGGINLNIDLLKGLVFRTSFNTNVEYGNSVYYMPTYSFGSWNSNKTATYTDGSKVSTYWNLNQLLQYNKQLGKHNFEVMASHESQASQYKNTSTSRTGYLTNDILDINAGDPKTAINSGGKGDWAQESYLGRLFYNFNDRYLITGTIRTDGSSNFGSNNRWGVFPAVSAAWRISNEPWYHVAFMNDLKLRLETGTTGNQGGGGIYSKMNSGSTQWGTGFLPSQYANPDLKWEETKTNNIGINVGFLQNRIQLEFDYYKKKTNNLIINDYPLPYYMGTTGTGSVTGPNVNFGTLENNGWTFSLISTNINTRNFKWESNFNISAFKTKITQLYSDAAFFDRTSWWMNNWAQRTAVGEAPWLFRGYIQEGIFQSVDEINNHAVPVDNSGNRLATNKDNVWVGDVKIKDISGPEGKPDGKIDSYDQTNIGNPWPKFFGGFTNTFSYKGFDLSILLTYSYGSDVYNYLNWQNTNPSNINLGRNLMQHAYDYARLTTDNSGNVTLQNPNTDLPRLTYDKNGNWDRFTNKWVEDGSYIKVKNITLGYTVPSKLLAKQKVVKDIRIMFSAQNIATLTHYKGYDPEVGSYVGENANSANQAIGIDYGRYPLTPIYTFNLLLNF